MLDTLAHIFDSGEPLRGVRWCTLFGGDPAFVTAVALRFESYSAVFRANPGDDTLVAWVGNLEAGPDERYADLSDREPWAACLSLTLSWGWRLTHQQGYDDGVRFEFGSPDVAASVVVEMVVVASAIRLFAASRVP